MWFSFCLILKFCTKTKACYFILTSNDILVRTFALLLCSVYLRVFIIFPWVMLFILRTGGSHSTWQICVVYCLEHESIKKYYINIPNDKATNVCHWDVPSVVFIMICIILSIFMQIYLLVFGNLDIQEAKITGVWPIFYMKNGSPYP